MSEPEKHFDENWFRNDDKKVNFYTGLPGFDVLMAVFRHVSPHEQPTSYICTFALMPFFKKTLTNWTFLLKYFKKRYIYDNMKKYKAMNNLKVPSIVRYLITVLTNFFLYWTDFIPHA